MNIFQKAFFRAPEPVYCLCRAGWKERDDPCEEHRTMRGTAEARRCDLCTGKSEYKTEDEVGSDLRGKGRPACQYGLPDTESGRQRMAWRGTFVSGYPKDPSGDNLRKFPV